MSDASSSAATHRPVLPLALCLGLACLSAPPSHADTLELANGDRVTGELVRLGEGTVWFHPAWTAEPIEIPWDAVVALETETPVVAVLEDGSRLEGRVTSGPEPGVLRLASGALGEAVDLPAARIVALNPPEVPAVRLTGSASAGLVVTDGNTDTRSLYAEGQLVARTVENRFTVGLQVRESENDGETTAENARASFEYDHFLTERWYFATGVLASRDEFQDVSLRTALSASSGYQFLDTERTRLAVELGASYVNVDRSDGEDEGYPAARWSLDLERELAAERVTLFHQQEGFLGLESGDDLFIRSRTGLRFSLWGGFIASTQLHLDYDESPGPGLESTDRAVLVNLGVEW